MDCSTFAFDLHVLGTPPALILSQDQTLKLNLLSTPMPCGTRAANCFNQRLVALLVVSVLCSIRPRPCLRSGYSGPAVTRRAGCLHVLSSFQRTEAPSGPRLPGPSGVPDRLAASFRVTLRDYNAPNRSVKPFSVLPNRFVRIESRLQGTCLAVATPLTEGATSTRVPNYTKGRTACQQSTTSGRLLSFRGDVRELSSPTPGASAAAPCAVQTVAPQGLARL